MFNESPQLYIVKQYSWKKKNTELILEIIFPQNPYLGFWYIWYNTILKKKKRISKSIPILRKKRGWIKSKSYLCFHLLWKKKSLTKWFIIFDNRRINSTNAYDSSFCVHLVFVLYLYHHFISWRLNKGREGEHSEHTCAPKYLQRESRGSGKARSIVLLRKQPRNLMGTWNKYEPSIIWYFFFFVNARQFSISIKSWTVSIKF